MKIRRATKALRILDFDIETRLVGFHSGGKFNPGGSEPTAIAWSWIEEKKVHSAVMNEPSDLLDMLCVFREFYDEADILTGHYITRFDLPLLNGAFIELGLRPLGPKLIQDTCTHLVKRAGWSKSQENMAGMLGVADSKLHMGDYNWRESTRLTPDGIEMTRRRVVDDVKQHKALRAVLLEAGVLKPPKVWRP